MLEGSDVLEWERRRKYLWALTVREAVTAALLIAYGVGIACRVVRSHWVVWAIFALFFAFNAGRRVLARRGIFSKTYQVTTLVLDVAMISLVVHFTGGVSSLLIPIYFIQVFATAILAGRRLAMLMALLASLGLCLLGWGELTGFLGHAKFLSPSAHLTRCMDPGYVVTFLCTVVALLLVSAAGMGRIGWMLHRAQQELAMASVTDEMTGLYNHRHFVQRLDDEIRRCQRYGHTTGLILIDLDHFKQVNDKHGHVVGDQALRHAADRLREQLRRTDLPARYGGEEFAIILPETPLSQAVLLAERLRTTLRDSPLPLDGGCFLRITLSAGVAAFPSPGLAGGLDLVRAADACLYRAKGEGRDRVCSVDGVPASKASA